MQGRVGPADDAPLVAATRLPVQVQIGYVGGGAAANLPVRVSALMRGFTPSFADYEAFSFSPPRPAEGEGEAAPDNDTHLVADKLPATLGREGLGQVVVEPIAPAPAPRQLVLEATYADPNGELQTLRTRAPCGPPPWWPASRPRAGPPPARTRRCRRWRSTCRASPRPACRWTCAPSPAPP
jgi:hypothetical protein